EVEERDRLHVEMRLYKSAGLRDGDVGMNVDGGGLRPDLAAGLAVLAGGGALVFVPLRHLLGPVRCSMNENAEQSVAVILRRPRIRNSVMQLARKCAGLEG